MPQQLAEDQRQRLDGIVSQMHGNNESDDDIQAVVDDFKSKYAAPPIAPTLLTSRQEASKQQFNANLPPGTTLSQGTDSPLSSAGAGLRDTFLAGLEKLGIDPSSPVVGTAKTTLKDIGRFATPTVPNPQGMFANLANTAIGAVKAPFQGPLDIYRAKNSTELGAGVAETATQTLPLIAGAMKLPAAIDGIKAGLDPEALMGRANALRPSTLPPPPSPAGEPGLNVDSALKLAGDLNPKVKLATSIGKKLLLKDTRASTYEWLANKLADKTPPPMPNTLQESKPGFETPGAIERADPATSAALDEQQRLDKMRSNLDQNGPSEPLWESGPLGIPRPQAQELPPAPADPNGGLLNAKPPAQHGNPIPFNPPAGAFKPRELPKSLIYQNVLQGIPQDTLDLLGRGKLNNIARDAEQVRMEQGFNPMDNIDKQLGSTFARQKMLATPEGQNVVMQLVNALKRQNAKDVMFYSKSLQDLSSRLGKR